MLFKQGDEILSADFKIGLIDHDQTVGVPQQGGQIAGVDGASGRIVGRTDDGQLGFAGDDLAGQPRNVEGQIVVERNGDGLAAGNGDQPAVDRDGRLRQHDSNSVLDQSLNDGLDYFMGAVPGHHSIGSPFDVI